MKLNSQTTNSKGLLCFVVEKERKKHNTDAMLPMIVEHQGLSNALALIIAASYSCEYNRHLLTSPYSKLNKSLNKITFCLLFPPINCLYGLHLYAEIVFLDLSECSEIPYWNEMSTYQLG